MTENNYKLSEDEFNSIFECIENTSRESLIVKAILSTELPIEKKIFFALHHGIQIGKGDFIFKKENSVNDIIDNNDYEKLGNALSNVDLTSDVTDIISCLDMTDEKKINIALRLGIGKGITLMNAEISNYMLPQVVGIGS